MGHRTRKHLRSLSLVIATIVATIFVLNSANIWTWAIGLFGTHHPALGAAASVAEAIIVGIAAIVAYLSYRSVMRTAARQHTLERIFQEHADREVIEQRDIFRTIKNDPNDKLQHYATKEQLAEFIERQLKTNHSPDGPAPEDRVATPEQIELWTKQFQQRQSAIIAVLNRYETFAIGIQERAIDESIYKKWWKSTLISDWYALKPTVDRIQTNVTKPAYREFKALAQKWDHNTSRDERDADKS
jgi:hypothetical protein